MTGLFQHKFSANEKNIQLLQREIGGWEKSLFYITEEIRFLIKYISADIFEENQLNMFEKFQLFKINLEEIRSESVELSQEFHNHKNDINGMMECEDVSCEVFYHEEHLKLKLRFDEFIEKFQQLKYAIFSFTGEILKK